MFQPTIISTSQSDDRIIIRFLMSRNKRNDYRLNWNSFKWKPTKRRLIRKERCLAIRCGRYFEKRSTSLFGESHGECDGECDGECVELRVKGWPALDALASLCLWLLDDDDGVRMGEVQLWCRHATPPIHIIPFQFILKLPIPSSAVDQAVASSQMNLCAKLKTKLSFERMIALANILRWLWLLGRQWR